MIIRAMKQDDLDEVGAIETNTFSLPWSKQSFLDACTTPENIYLVCVIDGHIAGYCGLWSVLGEGNITNMAVEQSYRQRGIGQALMAEMEKRGREMDVSVFFLEVRESNVPARRLYERMGYQEIGKRKRFYEKPVEDAIVMSKMNGLSH